MESIFVNTGYGLMLIALAVRDIFWLRVILVFGHSFVLVYSFTTGNYWVAFWNAFFIIINALRILLLWAEKRPCHIPEHLEDLYKNIFSSLHSREFQDFWNMGQLKEACDETIIHNGQKTTALSLILSGQFDVVQDEKTAAQLGRGKFVAEMGFLTGDAASADVIARGNVDYISWDITMLRSLEQTNSNLQIKIQNIIGKDLIMKVKGKPFLDLDSGELGPVYV